ncbi:hypothetical protein LAZ67_5004322 [Cordylochernes scorpioides]|uniref:Uncharacterized protein n=1 Tax=Cordylochernes scorpioides TaxID=51811 RepID=A0ABY6KIW8_9ARAC|nr:hypothetical protein LAZ67_5004322 [Cordylochernes scorpioides]
MPIITGHITVRTGMKHTHTHTRACGHAFASSAVFASGVCVIGAETCRIRCQKIALDPLIMCLKGPALDLNQARSFRRKQKI